MSSTITDPKYGIINCPTPDEVAQIAANASLDATAVASFIDKLASRPTLSFRNAARDNVYVIDLVSAEPAAASPLATPIPDAIKQRLLTGAGTSAAA